MTPTLPETHSIPAADPLVELVEQFQLRSQAEVAHRAADITPQNAQAVVHRNPTTAPGDFAYPMLEPLQ